MLGKQGQKERREVRQQMLAGQINIAVGTHALIEDDVEFDNLGLIIIDEQHRFGVKQRARLKGQESESGVAHDDGYADSSYARIDYAR